MNLVSAGATNTFAWGSAIAQLRGDNHQQAVDALRNTVLQAPEADVREMFTFLQYGWPYGKDLDPIYFALSERPSNLGGWLGKWRNIIDGIR